MARRIWPRMSIGFSIQADLTTEGAGTYTYLNAQMAEPPSRERKIQDFRPAVSQIGGNAARLAGSKHGGTFTLRFPMRGLAKTYDGGAGGGGVHALGTTDGMISPEMLLLGNAWGSAGSALVAAAADFTKGLHLSTDVGIPNDVAAGSTAGVIKVADATLYKEGQLFVAMTASDGANPAIGWIEDATAGTDVTLAEDVETAEIPANLDETYDTAVAWPSENARVPLTVRVLGNNGGFKQAFIGVEALEVRMDLGMGDLWWTEIDYKYTDRKDFSTGGGLQTPTDYFPIPALLGDDGGRMLYGDQGSATEVGAFGWRDMQLKVAWPVHDIHDINAPEGIGEMSPLIPEITLAAKIPVAHDDTISADGEDPYETILSAGGRKAFQFTSGKTPGEIGSLYLPAMQLQANPQRTLVEDVEYYDCVWESGQYSGDTGTDDAANAIVRFGVA